MLTLYKIPSEVFKCGILKSLLTFQLVYPFSNYPTLLTHFTGDLDIFVALSYYSLNNNIIIISLSHPFKMAFIGFNPLPRPRPAAAQTCSCPDPAGVLFTFTLTENWMRRVKGRSANDDDADEGQRRSYRFLRFSGRFCGSL